METIIEDIGETLRHVSARMLVRLSADLAALEALASTNEAIPDRLATAALFHRSAQRNCRQTRRYLLALSRLNWRHERTAIVENIGDNNE